MSTLNIAEQDQEQDQAVATEPVQPRLLDLEWSDSEWFQVWLQFSQKQSCDSN